VFRFAIGITKAGWEFLKSLFRLLRRLLYEKKEIKILGENIQGKRK